MKQLILSMIVLILGLSALSIVALTASRPDKLADEPLTNRRDAAGLPESHSTQIWNRTNCLGDNTNELEPESVFVDTHISSLSRDSDKPEPEAGCMNHRISYLDQETDSYHDNYDENCDNADDAEDNDDDEDTKEIVE